MKRPQNPQLEAQCNIAPPAVFLMLVDLRHRIGSKKQRRAEECWPLIFPLPHLVHGETKTHQAGEESEVTLKKTCNEPTKHWILLPSCHGMAISLRNQTIAE